MVESSGCPFFCGGSDDSDEARIFVPCRAPEIQCSYGFVGNCTDDSDLFEKIYTHHHMPSRQSHTTPMATVHRIVKNFFVFCRVSEPTGRIPCPARNPGELQGISIRVIRVIPRRTFQNPLFHPPPHTPPARISSVAPQTSPTDTQTARLSLDLHTVMPSPSTDGQRTLWGQPRQKQLGVVFVFYAIGF